MGRQHQNQVQVSKCQKPRLRLRLPLRLRCGTNGAGRSGPQPSDSDLSCLYRLTDSSDPKVCRQSHTLTTPEPAPHWLPFHCHQPLSLQVAQPDSWNQCSHPRFLHSHLGQSCSLRFTSQTQRTAALLHRQTGCGPPLRPVQGAVRGPLSTEGQIITISALELSRVLSSSLQVEAHVLAVGVVRGEETST